MIVCLDPPLATQYAASILQRHDARNSSVDSQTVMGVTVLDLPSATSEVAAEAFRLYLERRRAEGHPTLPRIPLPDFFIGAHAAVMNWTIATADDSRFRTYFPSVPLRTSS